MIPDDTEARLGFGSEMTETEAKLAADVSQNERKLIHGVTATSSRNNISLYQRKTKSITE